MPGVCLNLTPHVQDIILASRLTAIHAAIAVPPRSTFQSSCTLMFMQSFAPLTNHRSTCQGPKSPSAFPPPADRGQWRSSENFLCRFLAQTRSGAGRSYRQATQPSDLNSSDGWRSCDTAPTMVPVPGLDVVIAASHGAAISAPHGLTPGWPVLRRNCVPHIACVSCPYVAVQQCNCSIASMIVHETRPISSSSM